MWAANASEWFDYNDYIKYINVPSLIYVGEKEPSVSWVKDLANQLFNSHLHIFPGVDHCEVYWGSKLVAPVIKDFLTGIAK